MAPRSLPGPWRAVEWGHDQEVYHPRTLRAAEKYFKVLLQELGLVVPRTHDLDSLLALLLPSDATLGPLRRGLDVLSRYAVEYRYPSERATTRQMQSALRKAERIRAAIRSRLGLEP
jgi:HEPN domain-containing protein